MSDPNVDGFTEAKARNKLLRKLAVARPYVVRHVWMELWRRSNISGRCESAYSTSDALRPDRLNAAGRLCPTEPRVLVIRPYRNA